MRIRLVIVERKTRGDESCSCATCHCGLRAVRACGIWKLCRVIIYIYRREARCKKTAPPPAPAAAHRTPPAPHGHAPRQRDGVGDGDGDGDGGVPGRGTGTPARAATRQPRWDGGPRRRDEPSRQRGEVSGEGAPACATELALLGSLRLNVHDLGMCCLRGARPRHQPGRHEAEAKRDGEGVESEHPPLPRRERGTQR